MNRLRNHLIYSNSQEFVQNHILESTHDFDHIPFAPPGCWATIFNPLETRSSFNPRALDTWYIGFTWDHYYGLLFHLPSTGSTWVPVQYQMYPQHYTVPHMMSVDKVKHIEFNLIQTIQWIQASETYYPGHHTKELHKLTTIFKYAINNTTEKSPVCWTINIPTGLVVMEVFHFDGLQNDHWMTQFWTAAKMIAKWLDSTVVCDSGPGDALSYPGLNL